MGASQLLGISRQNKSFLLQRFKTLYFYFYKCLICINIQTIYGDLKVYYFTNGELDQLEANFKFHLRVFWVFGNWKKKEAIFFSSSTLWRVRRCDTSAG